MRGKLDGKSWAGDWGGRDWIGSDWIGVSGLEASILDMEDSIGDIEHAMVVGDHQDGAAVGAGEPLEQFDHVATGLAVEGRGRFVGENEAGAGDQRPGDCHPLPLSSRELGGVVMEAFSEPHEGEQFEGAVAHLIGGGLGMQLEHEFHILPGGEELEQVVLLEDKANFPPTGDKIGGERVMEWAGEHGEFPRLHPAEPTDEGQERGFSAAAGAGEQHDLSGSDLEGEVEENLSAEFSGAKGECHIAGDDGGQGSGGATRGGRGRFGTGRCAAPGRQSDLPQVAGV